MSGSRAADDHLEGSRLEPKPVEARDGATARVGSRFERCRSRSTFLGALGVCAFACACVDERGHTLHPLGVVPVNQHAKVMR